MDLLPPRLHLLTAILGLLVFGLSAPSMGMEKSKGPAVDKMEPPHWWNGGTEREFVLVLYGPKLSDCTVSTEEPRLTVLANERREHEDFLFVRIRVEPGCMDGIKSLTLTDAKDRATPLSFPIHDARLRPVGGQGIESGSTLYLIMPDRFANGDP